MMSATNLNAGDNSDPDAIVLEMNGHNTARPVPRAVDGITMTFKDVSVKVKKNLILDDVFGCATPGTVTAILGPSGCGKTTLLNALAGRIELRSGEVLFNGHKYTKSVRRTVNFVEQEDIFFQDLTLWETLMFRAMFTLPSRLTYKEKKARVQEVIDILGLEKCKHTQMGSQFVQGLSGGEKKRASIAAELISNPSAILLDEPTSGLDSTIAHGLIETIHRYAVRHNKTIVLTIHQPSSQIFYTFDRILLLYSGKVGYFGPVGNVADHLDNIGLPCIEHYNPADYLLDLAKATDYNTHERLASGVPTLKQEMEKILIVDGKMNEAPEKASRVIMHDSIEMDHRETESPEVAFSSIDKFHDTRLKWQSSFIIQVLAIFVRDTKYGWKIVYEVKSFVANLIFVAMLAVLAFQLGRTEEEMDNVTAVMFSAVTYFYFSSIRTDIVIQELEKDIIYRERASGLYRLSAFVMAKFLFIAIIRAGIPLSIWTCLYWLCLNDGFVKFVVTMLIVYYISLAFSSLNKLVVIIGEDQSTVISLTTVLGMTAYLTTGFWISSPPAWMSWAMYSMPLRYGDNALLATVVPADSLIICRKNGTSRYDECNAGAMNVTASAFLKRLTIYPSAEINIGILTAYMAIIWILIFLVLKLFRTPKH